MIERPLPLARNCFFLSFVTLSGMAFFACVEGSEAKALSVADMDRCREFLAEI